MSVLVTGGAGFLGTHLCNRLIEEGLEVTCLDNLLTGSLENISNLMNLPNFTFVQADVTKPIDLPGTFSHVLHFSSPASPKAYSRYPIHTLKVGAFGTYHALGLAKAHGARFILASTSEIYGDPEVNPQPETYWGNVNSVGPRSVYDEAKRYAEAITMAYHNEHGIQVRIARIFNTFGPGMKANDGRAIPNFLSQALRDEPLTIYGSGKQTRSFCYVDDLIEGIFRLMILPEAKLPPDDYLAPVFNLGNPEEVTIIELAKDIIRVTGSDSKIDFLKEAPGDPQVRRPDISKAKSILGWNPAVSRVEGLTRMWPYYRNCSR